MSLSRTVLEKSYSAFHDMVDVVIGRQVKGNIPKETYQEFGELGVCCVSVPELVSLCAHRAFFSFSQANASNLASSRIQA
eukprot:2278893-Amphidinium_carterae.1